MCIAIKHHHDYGEQYKIKYIYMYVCMYMDSRSTYNHVSVQFGSAVGMARKANTLIIKIKLQLTYELKTVWVDCPFFGVSTIKILCEAEIEALAILFKSLLALALENKDACWVKLITSLYELITRI